MTTIPKNMTIRKNVMYSKAFLISLIFTGTWLSGEDRKFYDIRIISREAIDFSSNIKVA